MHLIFTQMHFFYIPFIAGFYFFFSFFLAAMLTVADYYFYNCRTFSFVSNSLQLKLLFMSLCLSFIKKNGFLKAKKCALPLCRLSSLKAVLSLEQQGLQSSFEVLSYISKCITQRYFLFLFAYHLSSRVLWDKVRSNLPPIFTHYTFSLNGGGACPFYEFPSIFPYTMYYMLLITNSAKH